MSTTSPPDRPTHRLPESDEPTRVYGSELDAYGARSAEDTQPVATLAGDPGLRAADDEDTQVISGENIRVTGTAPAAEQARDRTMPNAQPAAGQLVDVRTVLHRQQEIHSGTRWGSAFFGWLTAIGTTVILAVLLTGAAIAVGAATETDPAEAIDSATRQATTTAAVIGGVSLLAVLLVAYYCGGYVAGRMARFSGIKQGIAVWVWGLAIAVLTTVVGVLLGNEFDLTIGLGDLPRIAAVGGDATVGGIIAALAAVTAALIGAILGGLAGMRYHRRVDRTGLGG